MRLNLTKIITYLKEPYPYYYNNQGRLILVLTLISLLSFCFSYFFEPFIVNTAEHKIKSIYILIIHAFIPFPLAYIFFRSLNRYIKDETGWTLGKEIFNLSLILLIIGIVNFLIRDFIYTNPDNWSFRYFWEEIRNTFLVGFLLLVIVLPLNLERLINKHKTSIHKIADRRSPTSSDSIYSVKDALSNELFELKAENFLFAKVEGNYTEVFTSSDDGIHKKLVRVTLKELEEQLKYNPQIYKTHRSYLVHLNTITAISGNAQGYQLQLKNCPYTVPVSRSHIKKFNAVYAQL